ncbi:MAG: hypothetical protein J7474_02435, partial [Arthrobacter sp.]|nr:hypothetical protein [Arthrobacter sp.]
PRLNGRFDVARHGDERDVEATVEAWAERKAARLEETRAREREEWERREEEFRRRRSERRRRLWFGRR